MRGWRKVGMVIVGMVAASLALAVGEKPARPASPTPAATLNRGAATAPDFALPDLDGKTVRLSDYRGQAVLLNFWATWCPPCRDEIPGFVKLKAQYGPRGLEIIGASLDVGGTSLVKRFAERFGINYPVVIADRRVQREYGYIGAVPTTFLIDPDGQVARKYIGFHETSEFEEDLQPYLQ